jgi:hypothetical protein
MPDAAESKSQRLARGRNRISGCPFFPKLHYEARAHCFVSPQGYFFQFMSFAKAGVMIESYG